MVVDLDDRPVEAGEVPRADARTDADAISDAERREHVARVDRVQEPPACVDRRCDRAEVTVELALGDRVEQRALHLRSSALRRSVTRAAASRVTGHREDGFGAPGRTAVIAAVIAELSPRSMATRDPGSPTHAQAGPSKAERRTARAAVGAYHEAELARLIEHVRTGLERSDQPSLALSRISIRVGRRRCCSRRRARYSSNVSSSPAARAVACARWRIRAAER